MDFYLNHIDHVAIRVASPVSSIAWYQTNLGFKPVQKNEWGEFPIMMIRGKCIIAIFPGDHPRIDNDGRPIRIDHFAFNVDNLNFKRAMQSFEEKGLEYDFQDHHFFHSLYLRDPDGHIVELTTLVKDDPDFGKHV